MAKETVEFLITAEDKASAKFKATRDQIDKNVKGVKEFGGHAKASTEMVGSLATTLGGGWLGQSAGEVAMLTERMSAFAEVQKTGTFGVLAFKAGLLAAAGVIGFKLGRALADIIWQTEAWRKKLERLREEMDELTERGISQFADRWNQEREEIELLVDPEQQAAAFEELRNRIGTELTGLNNVIKATQQRISDTESLALQSTMTEVQKQQLQNEKDLLKEYQRKRAILRDHRDEMMAQNSEQAKHMEFLREQNRLHKEQQQAIASGQQYVDQLKEEVALLKMTNDQQRAYNANKNTATSLQSVQAQKLMLEKEALLAAAEAEKEKQKAQEDRQKAQDRINDTIQKHIDQIKIEKIELEKGREAAIAYQLQLQGVDRATAERIARERTALDEAKQEAQKITDTVKQQFGVTGREDRFTAGRNITVDYTKKTSEQTEKTAKKMTDWVDKIAPALKTVLDDILEKLPTIEAI